MKHTEIMRISRDFAIELKKMHYDYNLNRKNSVSFCEFTNILANENSLKLSGVNTFGKKQKEKR